MLSSQEDSELIWRTLAHYPQAFLDIMMVEELNLLPPEVNAHPVIGGCITSISFILFGAIPLLPYFFAYSMPHLKLAADTQLAVAAMATLIVLFILGIIKANLLEYSNHNWMYSGTFYVVVFFCCFYFSF